jgi:AraC-like DNA-binding protein
MKKGTEKIYRGEGFTVYHQNFPKKQLKIHSHNEAHLFIPLEGHVELEVKGTIYKVKSGKMMFLSGQIPHSFNSTSEAGDRIIVQFDESLNRKFKQQRGKAVLLPTHLLIKDLILSLFPYAQSKFAASIGELILEVLVENLTLQTEDNDNIMFRIQEKVLSTDHPEIKKICTLMEKEMELSVDDIASETGISKRTLTRLVQQEIGLSPKELYTFFRIQKACELIYQGQLGLTAIAFECGYNSLSQFIENFKRWTGLKPSEFKPSH